MKLTAVSRNACLLVASVSAGLPALAASPPVGHSVAMVHLEQLAHSTEAAGLLKDIQQTSFDLTRNAETLRTYIGRGYSLYSHASQLDRVKEHINLIGGKLDRLQEIRDQVSPWQQQALDTALTSALTVAQGATAAILHLNNQPGYLWSPEYAEHLRSVADHAERLQDSVSLHLDLADAQERLEAVRSKIAESRS